MGKKLLEKEVNMLLMAISSTKSCDNVLRQKIEWLYHLANIYDALSDKDKKNLC